LECVTSPVGNYLIWEPSSVASSNASRAGSRSQQGAANSATSLPVTPNSATSLPVTPSSFADSTHNSSATNETTTAIPAINYSPADSHLSTCQIPDQRPTPNSGEAIAYPAPNDNPNYNNAGVTKIAVLAVDFSDSPGQGDAAARYQPTLTTAAAWVNRYSNGRASYQFETWDHWIRANGPIASYALPKEGDPTDMDRYAQEVEEFMTSSKDHFDFNGVGAVWVFFPFGQKVLVNPMDAQGDNVTLPDGTKKSLGLYSTSSRVEGDSLPMWGWFVHEMLHGHGLRGYFPEYPGELGIMVQGGQEVTTNLDSWNQLILNWLPEDHVYCVDSTGLKDAVLALSSQGTDKPDLESIMYKVNDHQVLVLEYQKSDVWSAAYNDDYRGIYAYLVDTKEDTTNEILSKSDFGTHYGTANYIPLRTGNHGQYVGLGSPAPDIPDSCFGCSIYKGVGIRGGQSTWNADLLLPAGGETKIYGLDIKVWKTDTVATVEIKPAA
jgi:hypothetical protein